MCALFMAMAGIEVPAHMTQITWVWCKLCRRGDVRTVCFVGPKMRTRGGSVECKEPKRAAETHSSVNEELNVAHGSYLTAKMVAQLDAGDFAEALAKDIKIQRVDVNCIIVLWVLPQCIVDGVSTSFT